MLPGYEKTAKYYQNNRPFKEKILRDAACRAQATNFAIRSCKYEPVEGEISNYTELFKAIHFFALLQKFAETRAMLAEELHRPIALAHEIDGHKSLRMIWKEEKIDLLCCILKYKESSLSCIFPDGESIPMEDGIPLARNNAAIRKLVSFLKGKLRP